jgi:hypothetical protein
MKHTCRQVGTKNNENVIPTPSVIPAKLVPDPDQGAGIQKLKKWIPCQARNDGEKVFSGEKLAFSHLDFI